MNKFMISAFLAVAALPGLAMADDYYLRGGIGLVELDSTDFDDSTQAWSLGFGWRFTDYLSVEVGYSDLGDYVGSAPGVGGPFDLRTTSLELGMAAKIPLGSSNWFGQVRAGAHRWENKMRNFETGHTEDGVDPYYGAGIGYDLTETFSLAVNYERYAVDGGNNVGDFDRVMLTFELR